MRREYFLENTNNIKENQKEILDFLFSNSDKLRLTACFWSELKLFSYKRLGGEEDPRFKKTLERLSPYLISKTTNNIKYNNIPQSKNAQFTHLKKRYMQENSL